MFGRVFTTIRTKTPRNVYDVRSEDTIVLLRTTWCIDMKVTINSFKAVATWKWDLPEESDDTCGICRVNFEGTCSKCKFPGDDCPIIVGECRHCFHMHCISDWISSDASQGKCPMCRQPFREKMADHPPRTPAVAATPRTPATAAT